MSTLRLEPDYPPLPRHVHLQHCNHTSKAGNEPDARDGKHASRTLPTTALLVVCISRCGRNCGFWAVGLVAAAQC